MASALASAITPMAVLAVLCLVTTAPGTLPSLSPPAASRITRIYAADGRQIATLGSFETFIPITPEDVPRTLKEAVVAIEDKRFYSHHGLGTRAVIRAFWTNLNHARLMEGGSTITQQYVKQVIMPGRDRTVAAKAKEAVRAIQLERQLSKDEILYRYLSTVSSERGRTASARPPTPTSESTPQS